MKLALMLAVLSFWTIGRCPAAQTTARLDGDTCVIAWEGDERIRVSFSRSKGILGAPVEIRVDGRAVSFDGFYAVFNGESEGYATRSIQTRTAGGSAEVVHLVEHAKLPEPARVVFHVSRAPGTKAIRFRVTTGGGKLHLDRFGIRNHRGSGIQPARMYFSKMFVLDAPIEPFRVKYNYNSTRFWAFTMANGLTELMATDTVPREFLFDPASGQYDMPVYCDSPLTYTFVLTGKGIQEAIAQYRSTIDTPAPPTIAQLPGRVTIMTSYPLRERYEDFLDELTGRGVRDFIWLAYAPWPGDRELVEPYGALYSVYDMYTDLFDQGPRKAEGFTPEWARYDRPGHIERGYWNAARCLPELYIEMAKTRVQGTLGRELEGRGFQPTGYTKYSNLAVTRQEVRPNALYLDVHASMTPRHYYDRQGRHHSVAESLRHEKALFEFARQYLGNVPVFSEIDGEAFAGIMDAGIFHQWPSLEKLGIKAAAWEYFPFIELVHRGRLLNSGAGRPFALPRYDAKNMATAIQFGRPQVILAYYGTNQDDTGGRARLYYLSSAFHKMLGLSGMDRIDLHGDSIRRQIASYTNGARIWSNRGTEDWAVEDMVLPPDGYLITGPGGFRQYRTRADGQILEAVIGPEYLYYSAEKGYDFGPVIASGAVAVRSQKGRVIVYELVKPAGPVQLRLGVVPGTPAGAKVTGVSVLLTRGRKVPLSFPDFRQKGPMVQFRPAEMATAVGYEVRYE